MRAERGTGWEVMVTGVGLAEVVVAVVARTGWEVVAWGIKWEVAALWLEWVVMVMGAGSAAVVVVGLGWVVA